MARRSSLIFALGAILLVGLAACGDGSASTPTLSPSASGRADLSPEVGGVEAAQRYLQQTGIDGTKGELTDPQSCAEVSHDTKGKFCIHQDFSIYAPALVILRIAKSDKPDDEVWEIRLMFQDNSWRVTDVKPFGESE